MAKTRKSKPGPKAVTVKAHKRSKPARKIAEQAGEPSVGRGALKKAVRKVTRK